MGLKSLRAGPEPNSKTFSYKLMSEENKAFMEGWRMSVKYPNVPPELMKALGNVIAGHFDRPDLRDYLEGVVCDSRSEQIRFAVAYQILPFTIFHCHMITNFYGRSDVLAFTSDMIAVFLEQIFPQQGKVRLGDYLLSDTEIQIAYNEFNKHFKNADLNVPSLQDIEVDFVELILFFFACRANHFRQLFTRAFSGRITDEQSLREGLKKLTISYGEEFVKYSTDRLTREKIGAAGIRITALMFDFIDATKHYKTY